MLAQSIVILQGLWFTVHVDAAWGGYFKAMMIPSSEKKKAERDPFIPQQVLPAYTQTQFWAVEEVDSLTVDPHKAGYIPYPAGFVAYR